MNTLSDNQFSAWVIKLGGEVQSLQSRAPHLELTVLGEEIARYRLALRHLHQQARQHNLDLMRYYHPLTDIEARLKTLQLMPHRNTPVEKIALFIDGANLSRACQNWLKQDIDYAKLLHYFARDAIILRAFYYVAVESEEELRRNRFFVWLKRNGYRLVAKQIKTFTGGEKKGDLDVDIAVDMLELADKLDRVVLFSGDGDFATLIKRVGMKGVRTQVVSYWGRGEGPTAPELLAAADNFVDLQAIIPYIVRD